MIPIIISLVIFICIILAIPLLKNKEGLVDKKNIPATGIIPFGYYRIDDEMMAKIPYGYVVDPNDPTFKKIIPATDSSFYKAKPVPIPANGIPDGYYKISDGFMGILPPDMKPDILSVNVDGTFIFKNGYINEEDFYKRRFPVPRDLLDKDGKIINLPAGTYLNDDRTTVSLLPYGQVAKGVSDPGYKKNPYLLKSTSKFDYTIKSYSDVKDNYDVEYHESADKLIRDSGMLTDISYGAITVLNPSGEYVVIPRSSIEGDITYLKPGSFKYQPSNYVPNYEDSVFLSRTTYLPTVSYYTPTDIKKGFCQFYKDNKPKLEENCNQLKPDSCAISSCCVLLGGSKCVSGNENGPYERSNYSDLFVRNKDFYYYKGKCYGNCS